MARVGWNDLSGLGKGQIYASIGGGLLNVFAAGAKADYDKYVARSKSLEYEDLADTAMFNMRASENQAQWISKAFDMQFATMTQKQGDEKATRKVSMASRGGVLGVGSNRDVMLSQQINYEKDKMTMNMNKVRARSKQDMKTVDYLNASERYKMNAKSMNITASSISPFGAMASSLLTNTSSVLSGLPEGMFMKKS